MKGPRQDGSRPAQRFRRALPTRRQQPTVAGVLTDIVALAKREVDTLAAKPSLSSEDVRRLESLIATIDRAQRTEERVLEAMRADMQGRSDEELGRLADDEVEET